MNTEDKFVKYQRLLNLNIQINGTQKHITFQSFIKIYNKLNKK